MTRSERRTLLAIVLATAVCLGLVKLANADQCAAKVRQATVVRVVDGDTLDVDVEVWPGLTLAQRVRLKDYNAPEAHGPEHAYGAKATAALVTLLPSGSLVYLEPSGSDKYGRLLAIAYRSELVANPTLETVVDALVAGGWGVRWNGAGKRPTPWLEGAAYPLVKGDKP